MLKKVSLVFSIILSITIAAIIIIKIPVYLYCTCELPIRHYRIYSILLDMFNRSVSPFVSISCGNTACNEKFWIIPGDLIIIDIVSYAIYFIIGKWKIKLSKVIYISCISVILLSFVVLGNIFISHRVKKNTQNNSTSSSSIVSMSCSEQEEDINRMISEANYCNKPSDCSIESFGCPFGCYVLVNRTSDVSDIRSKVESYNIQCGKCLYDCDKDPTIDQIGCLQNKCTYYPED